MNKAFTKESDHDSDEVIPPRFAPIPDGVDNLITAVGHADLERELAQLRARDPARGDGNADNAQRKKRAFQIKELEQRLLGHVIVESNTSAAPDVVGFGVRVDVECDDGSKRHYSLVGLDETDLSAAKISWLSPIARALWGKRVGDQVTLETPMGKLEGEIASIQAMDGAGTIRDR